MDNVLEYASGTAEGFKKKADHNKSESLWSFVLILIFSLIAPLFIAYGDSQFLGKVLPSIFTVISAGLTSWLQLRKPQKLWTLYRECQRLIEDQITRFNYSVDEYSENANREALLAKNVADIAFRAHKDWKEVVPSPENLSLKMKKNNTNV